MLIFQVSYSNGVGLAGHQSPALRRVARGHSGANTPTSGDEARMTPKYRTPPATPFQPAFYKSPENVDPDTHIFNPDYRLPSQHAVTSTERRFRPDDDYDGDTEF